MAGTVRPPRDDESGQQPGVGIDAHGGGVIDPTKNVLDLVRAESKYQDAMRDAQASFQNAMRDSQEKLQNWMRDAESKRVDQLASVRETYETRIADMLAESVRSTSTLVSSQLVQIQATFNDRVSKLEEFRWSSTGRSSVADPARDEAMSLMARAIASQGETTAATMSKVADTNAKAISELAASLRTVEKSETTTTARGMGRGEIVSYISMAVFVLAAVMSILFHH